MKKILKASSILSIATAATLITGVIKNKFLAVFLGPAGVGIVAQLYSYLNTTSVISSFGMTQGVTKYVAETYGFPDRRRHLKKILYSAIIAALSISLFFSISTILLSKSISSVILNTQVFYLFFVVIALALPLQTAGQMCISFIQGLKALRWFTVSSIITGLGGLAVLIPLVIFFGIKGAVWGTAALAIVSFGVFFYSSEHLLKRELCEDSKSKPVYFNKLVNFGFLRFIQTSICPITILAVRSLIIKKLGVFDNGLYEVTFAFSFFYVPLISNILWSYSYPNCCNAKDTDALSREVNQFIKMALFIATPAITFIILFRSFLIKILFSSAFLPAMDILIISLIGGLLKVLVWPFGIILMAKDKMKVAVFLEIMWNVIFLVLAFYVIPVYKLEGVFVVQNVSLFLLFIFNYIYIARTFSIKMTKNNFFMAVGSFLIILTASFLKPLL